MKIESVLVQAEQLKENNLWREAIELLSASNRLQPDIAIERTLTDYRIQAHSAIEWPKPQIPWAGTWEEARPDAAAVHEIDASEFDASNLARGVIGHGALIVRNLVPPDVADEFRSYIDHTIAARDAGEDNSPWYYASPFVSGRRANLGANQNQAKRAKVKKGSIWAVESPRTMQRLIELYEDIGLRSVLAQYFGELPALSVRKWVIRRISPDAAEAGWHQDGRFMGTGYNSMNLWLPLTECGEGTNAAGMEIIPNHARQIIETGTRGAPFQWTVGKDLVEELKEQWPVCHPHFNAGDALFFDHWNLHRTAFNPHLTEPRYAVESWFFSSSSIPNKQMPILF